MERRRRTDRRLPIERFPLDGLAWPVRLALTAALVLAMLLVRKGIDPWLMGGLPFVCFFPAVILAAFLFGPVMGTIAAVGSGLLGWGLFMRAPQAFPVDTASLLALGFFALTTAIPVLLVHWMQQANRALTIERETSDRLAATRELLFRELQHRVSNNLQVVAGLLSLQKRRVTDRDARAALDESARRLTVIGRISRQLYDPAGESRDLAAFLDRLATDVIDASGRGDVTCAVLCEAGIVLAPDRAVPLALIVAEAVANAIEHGLADRSGGIDIVVRHWDARTLAIEVQDDGGTLPAAFVLGDQDSLGLSIATMLARQIGGAFSLHGGIRTVARLTMPATE